MRSVIAFLLFVQLGVLSGCKDDDVKTAESKVSIDGEQYTVVQIGNQLWTAENYHGSGGVEYDALNSRPEYGKYYLKSELDAIPVPSGWRVPTVEDFTALAQSQGVPVPSQLAHGESIKTLISKTKWNNASGTNASGFNAYPANYVFNNSQPIEGDIAEFWAADGTTFSIQEAGAELSTLRVTLYMSNDPGYRFNVRFVKDVE